MRFKIHRGTKEIGGSCVEIWTNTTRIIIDFGLPLVNADKTQFDSKILSKKTIQELIEDRIIPNIQSLFQPGEHAALILSHAHQDHYGLINYLHKDCPVYLGKATHKLIELTNIFTDKDWVISNPHYFKSGLPFLIGDIEITPYLMDHSAFDAYAFLIKAHGKSLFYSGDFRIHGRKTKAFEWFSHNVEQNVDYLLLEGTAVGRADKKFTTENEIENQLCETFRQNTGINLIYTSGQNIDRLVSIYKACKKTGKNLIIDFYIANILTELAKLGSKIPYPSQRYPEIKVFFPNRLSRRITLKGKEELLFRFKSYKISRDEIDNDVSKIVMIVRPSMLDFLNPLQHLNTGVFIYSMWSGYKKNSYTRDFINTLINKGLIEKEIHTSGHADISGLKKMIEVLKPKNIIPIHTFDADQYSKIFHDSKIIQIIDTEFIDI